MDANTYSVIGMSPGNSYFKDEEIRYLLNEVVRRFGRTAILVADQPAISTYEALGYSESRARNKAIPKGNNLKNRTKRIMKECGLAEDIVRVIDWIDEIENDESYKFAYQMVNQLYENSDAFRDSVEATTREVLQNADREIADIASATKKAVHYLLSELAFLEFAASFLNAKKITYIYHKNWHVYEDYAAGKFDGKPKSHLDFLLIENPYETFVPIKSTESKDLNPACAESLYARIQRTRTIRVSFEDYPPAFFSDKENGAHRGIFYDVLKKIAGEEELELEFVEETGYGVIIDGLNERRFDIFGSAVWPTRERLPAASFSRSLYDSDVCMWVRESDNLNSLAQALADQSFRIVVKENDIAHSIVKEDFPNSRLVYAPQLADPLELLQFVAQGKGDSNLAEPYLAQYFNRRSSIKLVAIPSENPIRRYGNCFMIKRNELALKEMLDKYIAKYARSGYITHLIERYTGSRHTFDRQNRSKKSATLANYTIN